MSDTTRVGIIGAGWPGEAHAKGYQAAGGFKLAAVADLIPQRRKNLMATFGIAREYSDANDLLADKDVDAVSICLPNHLHAPVTIAALKAGKHVLCEKPPALSVREAIQMDKAATKAGKILLYGFQRRFGGSEQAARQTIAKGFAGDVYHVRSTWMRTRAIPAGTGWFTEKSKSGGGALIDIGIHMLDLGWHLLGEPKPASVYGFTSRRFSDLLPQDKPFDVEDAAFALIRFEGGKSLELAASWAINQPANQNGTVCRAYGSQGALEVYTPQGAVLYRHFDSKGESKTTLLKPPKTTHHAALMRHFRECIHGKSTPLTGGPQGIMLMEIVEAIYRSNELGKSVNLS